MKNVHPTFVEVRHKAQKFMIFLSLCLCCKSEPKEKINHSTIPLSSTSQQNSAERFEHIRYKNPPAQCTKMGGAVKHRSGSMGYERYNCEEKCKVSIQKPFPCQRKVYRNVDELDSSLDGQEVSVGGFLFQGNGLQPCSSKAKECCESCANYMILVDFKDKEQWKDCRRIFFQNDDEVMMRLVTMPGECCILDGLMEQVVVTGKIDMKGKWWTFTEVLSVCSLSSPLQDKP